MCASPNAPEVLVGNVVHSDRISPVTRCSWKPRQNGTRFLAKARRRKGELSAVVLCASAAWREPTFCETTIPPVTRSMKIGAHCEEPPHVAVDPPYSGIVNVSN